MNKRAGFVAIAAAMAAFAAETVCAYTPNLPVGYLGPDYIINTRVGPIYDAILSAPRPIVPPGIGRRGLFGVYVIADINIITGIPGHVRVLQSSGDAALDRAAEDALVQWRFRPRSVYKLTVPVNFAALSRSRRG